MLERRTAGNGVIYYASPLLESAGVRHGFSTRIGGCSEAPFDSLNLGNPSGCEVPDSSEHIEKNYELLQAAIGCDGRNRCSVHQVHRGKVVVVEADADWDRMTQADAM